MSDKQKENLVGPLPLATKTKNMINAYLLILTASVARCYYYY